MSPAGAVVGQRGDDAPGPAAAPLPGTVAGAGGAAVTAVPAGRRRLGPRTVERTDLGAPTLPEGALVDLVIACHNPSRPVGRAVASVLEGNPAAAVTLVCHNLPAEELAAALAPQHRGRVRYLEHTDPRPSPAGPFNAGLRWARAPWVSVMGSDDRLAPGAVASWLALARATGAQVVVARLALGEPSRHVPTPPARPSRLLGAALVHAVAQGEGPRPAASLPTCLPTRLAGALGRAGARLARAELVADRLAYRSAPLGLLSTRHLRRHGLALAEGAPVGEDVELTLRLFATARTVYDATGPCYLIGEDASDRVTTAPRPLREQLAFLDALTDAPWTAALSARARRALAVKAARIHVFGAVHYRDQAPVWTTGEREVLAATCRRLGTWAPGWQASLSVAERRLLDACLDLGAPAGTLIARSAARRRHGRPTTLATRGLSHLADREGPARLMAASLLCRALPGASDHWRPTPTQAGRH